MIFFRKQINSISISESKIVFELMGKSEIFEADLVEINNIFVGLKKIRDFYFFDLISFILVLVSLVLTYWYSSSNLFTVGVVIAFLRGVYLVNNKTYFVTVKLKDGTSFIFYFSNNKKNTFIEKIKIIRGKINIINFNVEIGKKSETNGIINTENL